MASEKKRLKELKRRYGKLAESMEPYYHQLDLRRLDELDDEAFAFIMEKVKGVNMLDLNETLITDKSIELLTQLEYVKELRVKSCRQLTNACIPFLSQLTQLEFLHVNHTAITIDGLLQLQGMLQMKTLLFTDDQPDVLNDKLEQLQQQLPGCELLVNSRPWTSAQKNDLW